MNDARFSLDNDFFSAVQKQTVVIFRFKKNRLLQSTMFEARDAILAYFTRVSETPEIKVVVIMATGLCDDCEQYQDVCAMIAEGSLPESAVLRMFRSVDQIMLTLVRSDTLFIGVTGSETVPLFLGVSLACDYRMAGESMVVRNLYLEEGMLPKGGLPFFFSRRASRSKAFEWLLVKDRIPASVCLELGIVDRIVPDDALEDAALAFAQALAERPKPILSRLKRLLNRSLQGLDEYLEQENQELCYFLEKGGLEGEL